MMMANWEKLNSKFNQVIDNMSNEDWNKWSSERMAKKAMRNAENIFAMGKRSNHFTNLKKSKL